nr:FAR1 DNA binding domain-containing protein [Tanacetum cinerariifolium]
MYAKDAEKSGFTIRKSTQEKLKSGIQARKYLLCNKEGLPKCVNKDTMSEETSENHIRTGSIIRTGCLARAKFKINVTHTGYVLYEFEEAHNHTFVPKAYRNLTKKRKQMSHPEQIFVQQLGSTSIGDTRAHHLYASTHGGYESVNATETGYRNHKRDLNAHIGEGDAQMLITKMTNKKLHICSKLLDNGTFRRRLHHLVWSLYIDPDEFEKKWHVLIEEFDLKENKWLKTEVEKANPNAKQLSKREMFNLVLGIEKPEVSTVKNPEPCSNKGNASVGQRKKSEIEKLREHMKKHKRLCKKCEKYIRHDSRNCPKKDDEIPTDSDSTVNDLGTGTADDNCEDNENDQ